MKVLNVAEKPSVARELVRHLGGGRGQRLHGHSKFNPVNGFPYQMFGRNCQMVVTSVAGHLMGLEFPSFARSWEGFPIRDLFDAPVEKKINKASSGEEIAKTLREHSRQAAHLVLWLDCDREGENIAFEVVQICLAANRSLGVHRAQFSALTKVDLERACRTVQPPNKNLSDAVDVRQEIDLRIGAAFTRLLTLRYKSQLGMGQKQVVSYGPCQFPTLGFVVDRFLEVKRFRSETFWSIKVTVEKRDDSGAGGARGADTRAEFLWDRNRVYDRAIALCLFEMVAENPTALITEVVGEPKSKWRPLPLTTVEMTKLANRKLHLASAQCMELAEKLYQRGFISYPRTETDKFTQTMDLRSLVREHLTHSVWGDFANRLDAGGEFRWPRSGSQDDQAHPPIHPVRSAEKSDFEDERSWKLYEMVTRRFLACCSQDAQGFQTRVKMDVAGEGFHTRGLIVTQKNYLDVYFPYESWSGVQLPNFLQWEQITPRELVLHEGRTEPPSLLTEADLIDLMDKNGIGTDATMHEHIKTIQERQYARKIERGFFEPSQLGVALVCGFRQVCGMQGVPDISKPALRSKMEADMREVSRGCRRKEEVLQASLSSMRQVFFSMSGNLEILDRVISRAARGGGGGQE